MADSANNALTTTPERLVAAPAAGTENIRRSPQGVVVTALDTNTTNVMVGFAEATVATVGYKLEPGKSVVCPVDDPSQVWVCMASGTGDVTSMWG
jgi:hypothetical protein